MSADPDISECKASLSQQLATLCQHLRDEIEKWQNQDEVEVIPMPPTVGYDEELTSSRAPSVAMKNQHSAAETKTSRSPQTLANSSVIGYTKLKTASDMSGELYEVKMVALLFLRGINRAQHFYLGANMDAAGQFDDVIFKVKLHNEIGWLMNFIQLKHKLKAKVTQSALLSLSKNDFGIVKYCHSYLGVKSKMEESQDLQFCGQFEKINFIIYTNAYVDKDLQKPDRKLVADLGTPFISTRSSSNSIMFCLDPLLDGVIYQGLEDITTFKSILVDLNHCFEFDEENVSRVLAVLNTFVVSRHGINGELVRIVEKLKQDPSKGNVTSILAKDLVTVANFSCYQEFVEKLQIFTGQANEKELDALIKEEIATALRVSNPDVLHKMFIQITTDIQDWWRDGAYFLTEDATFWNNIMSSHIAELSSGTVHELQDSGLSFNDSYLEIVKHMIFSSGVLNLCTKDGSSFLTMLKVYQAFNDQCCIFVDLESLIGMKDEILCAWQKRRCRKLVIDCTESSKIQNVPRGLFADIYYILNHLHDIRLILVSSTESSFANSLRETVIIEEFDSVNQWSQLSKTSQTVLLEKNVTFQEEIVPFVSLAGDDDRLTNQLKGNALMQLLKSQLKIGPVLESPVEYYISRQLARNGSESFHVQAASDVSERVVLIIAEPGMGKTTLLSHLAVTTKRHNPTKWVVRINLNDCTTYLAGLKYVPMQEMESVKFLVKNVLTNGTVLEDTLLKHSLQTANGMVVFIDSVDEVCPLYEKEVCFLLKHLLDTGIEKLWVTSRTTLKEMLEETLNTSSFSLVPFKRQDQENFLCKYWNSKLVDGTIEPKLKDSDNVRLKEFAVQVLSLASSVFKGDDLVISIPQQTLMLAELFEVEFANYCKRFGSMELPKRLDVILLYESFVRKKFDVYIYEKKKTSRDNAAVIADNENTFNVFRENHMAASLVLLLTAEERMSLSTFSETSAQLFLKTVGDGREKNGILVGVADQVPRFVHRTFAEYFTACWFAEKKKSTRQFLEHHLFEARFSVVKRFFDNLLVRNCPLHLAVLGGDVQTSQELLDGGFTINTRDGGGRTALHLAAGKDGDCLTIVNFLLDRGASLDVTDELFGWRPLRYADRTEAWTVAGLLLLRGGAEEDLVEARRRMQDDVFVEFVNHLRGEGTVTKLMLVACRHGDLRTVEYSVGVCSADVNARGEGGRGAMHLAAEGGHAGVMRFLSDAGASHTVRDDRGDAPLHSAIRCDRYEAIDFLLNRGGFPVDEVDADGRSPLTTASGLGALNVMRRLIDLGADVNACTTDGWTPLLWAARQGHVDAVRLLVVGGAKLLLSDMNVEQNNVALLCIPFLQDMQYPPEEIVDEATLPVAPLNFPRIEQGVFNGCNKQATANNDIPYIQTTMELAMHLLATVTSVDYRNKKGKSALHYAALCNNYDLARLLIERDASVNITDNEGICPLHCIAIGGTDFTCLPLEPASMENSHIALMQLLLSNGADITLRTANGSSFRDIALKRELNDIIEYFAPLDGKLTAALKGSNVDEISDLVSGGALVDSRNEDVHNVLTAAVRGGNLDVARLLLESGADVNTCDVTGRSLLLSAAFYKKWEVVKYLVKMGVDCSAVDKDGRSVLYMSLQYPEVVELLCENGANVNTPDSLGKPPLLAAMEMYLFETVVILIERGADIEAVDVLGRTLFHIACDSFNFDLMQLLLKKGCNISTSDIHGYTPLMSAARSKSLEIVKILVDSGVDVNIIDKRGTSALHVASSFTCNLDIVQFLVEHEANIDKLDHVDQSPLMCAANGKSWDNLEYLIGCGVDVNVCDHHGRSALDMSVGDLDSVKLLIANGAYIHKPAGGRTPLLCAVFEEKWDTAEFLVMKGVDVNVLDDFGFSAFHLASEAKHFGTMRILAENGANVNTLNKNGLSPLLSAAATSSWDVVKVLIELGADVRVVDRHGRTLFHIASDSRDLDVMTFLVEKGLDVCTSDSNGWTPLMSAVRDASFVVAMFLLDHGVDVEATDSNSRSALNVACDKRDGDMLMLLMGRGLKKSVYHKSIWKTLIWSAAHVNKWDIVALCLEATDIARHTQVGESALFWAIRSGIPEIINYITQHSDEFTSFGQSDRVAFPDSIDSGPIEEIERGINDSRDFDERVPPFIAAKGGHLDLMMYLRDHGADLSIRDIQSRTILFEACRNGKLDVIGFLIENGSDVNARDKHGRSPIFDVASLGRLDVVSCLIKHGADMQLHDVDGKTPLSEASLWGRLEVVECLILHGAEIDRVDIRGRSCLFDAVSWGRLDVVRYLVGKGANPAIRDVDGASVLNVAVGTKASEALALILELGVDPDLQDDRGRSAIFNAASCSSLNAVRCLVKNGANPNHRDNEGMSALFAVSSTKMLESVQCLIENGADPNLRDNEGRSAIFLAANVDSLSVVQYLLDHGADPNLQDNNGRTALFGAVAVGAIEAVRCLIDRGADTKHVDNMGYSVLDLAHCSTLEVLGLVLKLEIKP